LGEAHRVVTRGRWSGDRDLSATVSGTVDDATLTIVVDVRDDEIVAGDPPLSDGLELYLDLRPDGERGQAYYTRQVAMLLIPPLPRDGLLGLPEDDPPPALLALPTAWQTTAGGYRVTLAIPRATLDDLAGWRVTELGFDLAVRR